MCAIRNKHWEENPELKKEMAKKCSKANTKYKVHQYDKKTKKFIKTWNSVMEIIEANPTYKKHNIYAACSGEKPTMYGYIWKKELIDDLNSEEKVKIDEDIVQA